jgi:hypothetical protein
MRLFKEGVIRDGGTVIFKIKWNPEMWEKFDIRFYALDDTEEPPREDNAEKPEGNLVQKDGLLKLAESIERNVACSKGAPMGTAAPPDEPSPNQSSTSGRAAKVAEGSPSVTMSLGQVFIALFRTPDQNNDFLTYLQHADPFPGAKVVKFIGLYCGTSDKMIYVETHRWNGDIASGYTLPRRPEYPGPFSESCYELFTFGGSKVAKLPKRNKFGLLRHVVAVFH